MSRNKIINLIVIVVIFLLPVLLCSSYIIYDWVKAERQYNQWLAEDPLRMDFSQIKGSGYPAVREALLKRLPIGTSEEELKAFYFANKGQFHYSDVAWDPKDMTMGVSINTKAPCNYCAVMRVYATKRGHMFEREWGEYLIFFELDPNIHTLKDIHVFGYGFGINL